MNLERRQGSKSGRKPVSLQPPRWLALILVILSANSFARPVRGWYEVPVNEDLKPFAKYPVKFEADQYGDRPQQLRFPLPAELLGDEKWVTMNRIPDQPGAYHGEGVGGTCEKVDRYFTCTVRFTNLNVDVDKVKTNLQSKALSQEEVNGRIQVARHFGSEPIGVLIYRLRGGDR